MNQQECITFLTEFEDVLSNEFNKSKTAHIVSLAQNILLNSINDDDFLIKFLTAKQVEGRSEKTIKRYQYIIKQMLKCVNKNLPAITIYDLRYYLNERKRKGVKDKTLEGERAIFNSLFNWLHKEGLIKNNPCANLNAIKYRKEIRLPFSDVEIARLHNCAYTARDKALLSFLLCTGCRISEVTALNRSSIDFINLEVTVLGKGNKERTVYLDEVCAMELQEYFKSRKDSSCALFVGKGSERLTNGAIRAVLKKIGHAANIENVHPHRFRRTLATNLIRRGMSIQSVAAILGHEDINTTMTYVYLDKKNIKNDYQKFF